MTTLGNALRRGRFGFWRLGLEGLLIALTGWLMLAFDVGGFHAITDRFSLRLWNAAYDAMLVYPTRDEDRNTNDRRRNMATVILVDEKTLVDRNEPYPPTGKFHAEMIREVTRLKPHAIMIDFLFGDWSARRGDKTFDELWMAIREANDNGVHVAVAATFDSRGNWYPLHDGLEKLILAKVVTPVWVRREDKDSYDQIYRLRAVDRQAREMPMQVLAESAALFLYKIVCNRIEQTRCTFGYEGRYADDMEIFWSGNANEPENIVAINCRLLPGPWGRFRDALRARPAEAGCPYTPSIAAGRFLDDGKSGASDRRYLIEGKVVFYGGAIGASGDVTTSPLHGDLPGIYTIVMAFDNLLAWEDRYYRRAHGGFEWIEEYKIVEGLALVLIVIAWPIARRFVARSCAPDPVRGCNQPASIAARCPYHPSYIERFFGFLIRLLLGIALCCLIVVVETHVFDLAPLNWFGLFSIIVLGESTRRHLTPFAGFTTFALFTRRRGRVARSLVERTEAKRIRRCLARMRRLSGENAWLLCAAELRRRSRGGRQP